MEKESNLEGLTQEKDEKKPRKRKLLTERNIAIIFVVIFVCAFLSGFFCNSLIENNKMSKLQSIVKLIEENGLYMAKIDAENSMTESELINSVVNSVLQYDKYAVYYSRDEYNTVLNNNNGKYFDIGFSVFKGSNRVYSVTCNSPAERGGIVCDDIVVGVKGKNSEEKIVVDEESLMTGLWGLKEQEEFYIRLKTAFTGEEKIATVSCRSYTASYVKYYDNECAYNFVDEDGQINQIACEVTDKESLDSDTACIKISGFHGELKRELQSATTLMKEKGKSKLAIDLRRNGGGSLDVLKQVVGNFVYNGNEKNSVVFYSRNKNGQMSEYKAKTDNYLSFVKQMVVLADDGTASASECLIGAMLYYGEKHNNFSRENLVICKGEDGGYTTYGKGIMQRTFEFGDKSALKMTTEEVILPDKQTSIHGKGFTTVEKNQVERENALNRAIEILRES